LNRRKETWVYEDEAAPSGIKMEAQDFDYNIEQFGQRTLLK